MLTYFCPSCGSPICMSDNLEYVYCEICGNKAFSKDVMTFQASPRLLASEERLRRLPVDILFNMAAWAKQTHKEKLLRIADEKGHLPASLQLGIDYYCEKRWDDSEHYLKKANEGAYPEAEALLLIIQDRKSNISNLNDFLKKLRACDQKKFAYQNIHQHCKDYIVYIQNKIHEQERQERLRRIPTNDYGYTPQDVTPQSDISAGAGAFAYPDVLGPSYHPDAPRYDPETIVPGEVW